MAVDVGGRPLNLGPARQRLVLAALVADVNRVVPVGELMVRVWGEDPPPRARSVLGSYVSRLRSALGEVSLTWRSGGYMLATDRASVDMYRFHDLCDLARATTDDLQATALLTEALGLWRGPALTGLDSSWASAERDRLRLQRLQAEHDLIEARLRAGHGEGLVAELSGRASEHPLDERAAGQYMLALYRAGRGADALQHYRRIRSRLAEELGTDPGPRLQELHQRILQADPDLTGPPPTATSTRVTTPDGGVGASAMHSLRGDIAAFTGRDQETQRLLDAVTAGDLQAIAIHTVDGMAGVGKTAFAVHLAHRLAGRFPDGQLFVELHGHTPGLRPVTTDEALASLLLATGLPAATLPAKVDDRARLWRHRVAGKRVLIVLDDAADHDQVRPLLPATAGALVLITSRHRLPALDSVLPVTLTVLPPDEAIRMLHRLAEIAADRHDPDAAAQVARACGHLPLAIAAVAGQLRSHPTWTVRHLADRLAAIDSRLDTLAAGDRSVAVAFDMSFNTLPAHQQHLFRLLGAHPGPEIDAFAVAALLNSDLPEAHRHLESLHADHLLDEVSPGRYQMHDLVRAYARHRATELDPQERAEAFARVLVYYLHTTIAATHHVGDSRRIPVTAPAEPPRHWPAMVDSATARAWLSQELATLSACVEGAERAHDALAIELAAAMHPFLLLDAQWQRALAVHAAALTAAVRRGDRRFQANFHHALANVGRMLCEFDAAARHLADAVGLYAALGDQSGRARVLAEMGIVHHMQGDYAGAVAPLTEAHDLFLALGNDEGRAIAMRNLGCCHYFLGHYDLATSLLSIAGQALAELGKRDQQGDALRLLSMVLRQRGELRQACDAAAQARRLAEDTGSRLLAALADTELGLAQRDLGNHVAAMATLRRAEDGYSAVGFRPGTTSVNTSIGTVYRATGQYATATRLMTDAWAEQHDLGVLDDELDTLIELGALAVDYADAGDPQLYFRQALDIARQLGLVAYEARALAGLGQVLLRAGDPAAMTFLQQALDIYDRLGLPAAGPVAELVKEAG